MTEGFAKVGLDPYRGEEHAPGGTKAAVVPGRTLVGTVPSSFQNGLFRNEIVIEFTRELCELLGSIMVEAEGYKNGLGDPSVEDPSALTKEAKQRRYQRFLSWLVDMRPSEFETRFQKFLKVNGDRPKRFYSMLINSFVVHVYKASSKSSHRHASIAPLDYPRLDSFVRFFLKNAAREQAIVFNTWPRCNPSDHLLITENAIRKTLYDDITNNLSVEYVVQESEESKGKEERRARRRREREEREKRENAKVDEGKRSPPSSSGEGRRSEVDKKSEERRSVAKDKEPSIREVPKEKAIETPVVLRDTARVNRSRSDAPREMPKSLSTPPPRPFATKGESPVPKPSPEPITRPRESVAKYIDRDDSSKRSAVKAKETEPKESDASSKKSAFTGKREVEPKAGDVSSKKFSTRVEEAERKARSESPKELADPNDLQASPEAEPEASRLQTFRKGSVTFHVEVSASPAVQKPPSAGNEETTGYVRPVEEDDGASKRSRGSTSSKRRGRAFVNPLEE